MLNLLDIHNFIVYNCKYRIKDQKIQQILLKSKFF